jgi:hypothetical protein
LKPNTKSNHLILLLWKLWVRFASPLPKNARKRFRRRRELSYKEKRDIFQRAKKILLQRSSEVAQLLTLEKGSPLTESLSGEVMGVLELLDYYGQNLKKSLKSKKEKHHVVLFLHKKSSFHFQPLGVTLVISPWNFPFLIPFYDIIAALAAGNTVVQTVDFNAFNRAYDRRYLTGGRSPSRRFEYRHLQSRPSRGFNTEQGC